MQVRDRIINAPFYLLLMINLLLAALPLSAQTRRHPTQATTKVVGKDDSCHWSGNVTYSKKVRLDRTNSSGTQSFSTEEDYAESASISGDSEVHNLAGQGFTANANATVTLSRTNITVIKLDTGCPRTTTNKEAGGGSGPATIFVSIMNGKYSVGLGGLSSAFSVAQSGDDRDCTLTSPVNYNRQAKTIHGGFNTPEQPLTNANQLSGSYSVIHHESGTTETIRWHLVLCPPPLEIVSLKLEERQFPDKDKWVEVNGRTIDGNQVRVTATVMNNSTAKRVDSIKFRELKDFVDLPDSVRKFTVLPGQKVDVEYIWDTSGYAWTDGVIAPRSDREIEANIRDYDKYSIKIQVNPKPVILVHGLNSEAATWDKYQGFLEAAHSSDWMALPVDGMNTGAGLTSILPTNTISQNAKIMADYIKAARTALNAWHVDIVGHSMGGLISRLYIATFMPDDTPDNRPVVTHLVMLGTPNMGSPCADTLRAIHYIADADVEAVRQLQPKVMDEFNKKYTDRKGVKFSILAGNPLPIAEPNIIALHALACRELALVPNDGVVKVESAFWTIQDRDYTKSLHTFMTGSERDFKNFVLPRLAIGPVKARSEAQ